MRDRLTYYPTLEVDYFHTKPECDFGWHECVYTQTVFQNGLLVSSKAKSVYVKRFDTFDRLIELWNIQGETPLRIGMGNKPPVVYTATYAKGDVSINAPLTKPKPRR